MNLIGNIDLLQLQKSCIVDVKGTRCVLIPIAYNDIYVSMGDDNTAKSAKLGISINERREASKYGYTHYSKQAPSKSFRQDEKNKDIIEAMRTSFVGDYKPFEFEGDNQAEQVKAATADVGDVELPF